MTAISEISKLSWRAIENDYSLDQYEEELERIKNKKRNYVPYVVAIGAGFACGGFCKLFGGDWMAFLFTSICAFAGFRVRARCMEFGINHYMSIAIAALISTHTPWPMCLRLPGSRKLPIIRCWRVHCSSFRGCR